MPIALAANRQQGGRHPHPTSPLLRPQPPHPKRLQKADTTPTALSAFHGMMGGRGRPSLRPGAGLPKMGKKYVCLSAFGPHQSFESLLVFLVT